MTRITDNDSDSWSPTWSPDGQTLYFITNRTGGIGLWRTRLDVQAQPLGAAEAVPVPTAFVAFPRAGATGDLVYADANARRNIELLSFDAQRGTVTGPLRQVTNGTDFWMMPRPSPRGEWVTFVRAGLTKDQGVFTAHRDGSQLRRLTDNAGDHEPDISPDKQRIAFDSTRGGAAGIWLIDADGGNLQRLTPSDATAAWTNPRWSPDGRMIAARQQPGNRVVVFDANRPSAAPSLILPVPEGLEMSSMPLSVARLAWSSDGRQLAARFGTLLVIYSLEHGTYRTTPMRGGIVGWPPGPFLVIDRWVERRLAVLDTRTWETREVPYAPHLMRDDRLMLSADGGSWPSSAARITPTFG